MTSGLQCNEVTVFYVSLACIMSPRSSGELKKKRNGPAVAFNFTQGEFLNWSLNR